MEHLFKNISMFADLNPWTMGTLILCLLAGLWSMALTFSCNHKKDFFILLVSFIFFMVVVLSMLYYATTCDLTKKQTLLIILSTAAYTIIFYLVPIEDSL